jgi:hypothetical protein
MTLVKKSSKPKSVKYFTEETEQAIIKYNSLSDPIEKNILYNKYIHVPFLKLTENIIHTFKFYNIDSESLENLQHEIIVFLISKLNLFHHSNNIQDRIKKIVVKEFNEKYTEDFTLFTNNASQVNQHQIHSFIDTLNISTDCKVKLKTITPPKAYSYFGTIVKRYLINNNNKNYYNKILNTSFEEAEENDLVHVVDSVSIEKLNLYINEYVDFCTENIYTLFPKKHDAQVADAVLELFRKRKYLNLFNKKAIYIYIREIVIDVKTSKITTIINKLYKIFKEGYVFYLENDYIKFNV